MDNTGCASVQDWLLALDELAVTDDSIDTVYMLYAGPGPAGEKKKKKEQRIQDSNERSGNSGKHFKKKQQKRAVAGAGAGAGAGIAGSVNCHSASGDSEAGAGTSNSSDGVPHHQPHVVHCVVPITVLSAHHAQPLAASAHSSAGRELEGVLPATPFKACLALIRKQLLRNFLLTPATTAARHITTAMAMHSCLLKQVSLLTQLSSHGSHLRNHSRCTTTLFSEKAFTR